MKTIKIEVHMSKCIFNDAKELGHDVIAPVHFCAISYTDGVAVKCRFKPIIA